MKETISKVITINKIIKNLMDLWFCFGQDADGFEQFHSKFFRIKFLKLDIQCAIIDTAYRLSFTVYFLMFFIFKEIAF